MGGPVPGVTLEQLAAGPQHERQEQAFRLNELERCLERFLRPSPVAEAIAPPRPVAVPRPAPSEHTTRVLSRRSPARAPRRRSPDRPVRAPAPRARSHSGAVRSMWGQERFSSSASAPSPGRPCERLPWRSSSSEPEPAMIEATRIFSGCAFLMRARRPIHQSSGLSEMSSQFHEEWSAAPGFFFIEMWPGRRVRRA